MPIGFKNSTEGDVQGAVDAVAVAGSAQVFPGITDDGRAAIFSTDGNPDCHVVLRGADSGPNYDEKSVADLCGRLARSGLKSRVVIDASHGNSGKNHHRQSLVTREVASLVSEGDRSIVGVMIESFLVEGRQDLVLGGASELVYGKSITDGCVDWDTTLDLFNILGSGVERRRSCITHS